MRVEQVEANDLPSEEWDALTAAGNFPNPFLASWWLAEIAVAPLALLCRDPSGRLVGGLVVDRDRLVIPRLRMPGQGVLAPDHLDVVALPGHADEVARAIVDELRSGAGVLVDLDGLAPDGALARALGGAPLERVGAPYADISAGAEAYLAARPGRVRSTVSRTRKRLERDGVTVRRVERADLDRALRDLHRLHDTRWADESNFLSAWTRFERAARAGADRDRVVVHELVTPTGTVVATELDLVAGTTLAFYQAGRLPDHEWRGAGSVLRAAILEWAAGEGYTEYDLLRGDEPYKAEWATGRRELVRIRAGLGPAGRTVQWAADVWRAADAWRAARSRRDAHRAGPPMAD